MGRGMSLGGKVGGTGPNGLKLVRGRPKGWTKRKVERFLDTLGLTGNVSEAARACGMSRDGAYRFRQRDPEFRRAWEKALVSALDMLTDKVVDYALNGEAVKVRYGGQIVDEEIRFDAKFALNLLRIHADTVRRVKAEADDVDGRELEVELRNRLELIQARLKGLPEPGSDEPTGE